LGPFKTLTRFVFGPEAAKRSNVPAPKFDVYDKAAGMIRGKSLSVDVVVLSHCLSFREQYGPCEDGLHTVLNSGLGVSPGG